jgi:pimeloyl-ACP methyl ester carboxylesterase
MQRRSRRPPGSRRGWIRLAVAAGGLTSLAACTPSIGWSGQSSSPSPPASAAGSACAPRNITNTPGRLQVRTMDITWDGPLGNCDVVQYNIVTTDTQGKPAGTVRQVAATATSATVPGLGPCSYYRFGVQAVTKSGTSSVTLPSHDVFLSGPPDSPPKLVAIVLQGITSHDPGGAFNPATATFCTTPNGTMPPSNAQSSLQVFDDQWLNYNDNGSSKAVSAAAGANNNLIDTLANTGAYVLPFSYDGATLSGSPSSPWFTTASYTGDDVGSADPLTAMPARLQAEIDSIRKTLPDAKILIIGHSNGGLVAEQWWLNTAGQHPDGVVQVFSLDSPVNGVMDAAFCMPFGCGGMVSSYLGGVYASMWHTQSKDDPGEVQLSNTSHLYTAVATYGDPLYDAGDNGVTNLPTTDSHVGTVSQMFYTEPNCANDRLDPFDLSQSRCQPAGQYFIDPCSLKDGKPALLDADHTVYGPFAYGFPGDADLHSVVKNCPGVIQKIMTYAPSGSVAPTPPPTPAAAATVVKKFEPWVAVGQAGSATPAPGLVVTNGGTAACDSGSSDDPGSAWAVRCMPPGNGMPCFINDTGGGDPGSPVLCSSDPTSKQVIEVTPTGANGIPVSMLNHADPSQPAWFLILADRRKCAFLGYGTNTNMLSYNCGGNIGATVPDRSQPTWTVQEGTLQLNPTPSSTRVAVVMAYR